MLGPGLGNENFGGGADSGAPEMSGGVEDVIRDEEARPRGGTLFGFSGGDLRTLGIILVVIGFLFFIGGTVYAMSGPAMPQLSSTFGQDSQTWFNAQTAHMLGGFVLAAIGMVFFAVGGYALRFGLIRPVSSFVASEASPAIETASVAIGRGLAEARNEERDSAEDSHRAVETIVKVKCKDCGHLNEESAKFCDECGKAL